MIKTFKNMENLEWLYDHPLVDVYEQDGKYKRLLLKSLDNISKFRYEQFFTLYCGSTLNAFN